MAAVRISRRRPASPINAANASTVRSTSLGSTSTAFTSSFAYSSTPPQAGRTTAQPHAIASSPVRPKA